MCALKDQIVKIWCAARPQLSPIIGHFIVRSYLETIDVDVPSYLMNEFQSADYRYLSEISAEIIELDFFGNIYFRNGIIGQYILHHEVPEDEIVDAIYKFCRFVSNHVKAEQYYKIVQRILRYWNLRRLFRVAATARKVFDKCSQIQLISSDPYLWIQYSIAEMELGNFFAADRFVTTAYAKAKERGRNFDTYQIDTHSVRLLVRRVVSKGAIDGLSSELAQGIARLRAVMQRRPEEAAYHVSSVVVQMLSSDIDWKSIMRPSDYQQMTRSLAAISLAVAEITKQGVAFDVEQRAIDLISGEAARAMPPPKGSDRD